MTCSKITPRSMKYSVLGREAHLWGDVTENLTFDGILWPRKAAALEVLWNGKGNGKKKVSEDATRILAKLRERLPGRTIVAGMEQMEQMEWSLSRFLYAMQHPNVRESILIAHMLLEFLWTFHLEAEAYARSEHLYHPKNETTLGALPNRLEMTNSTMYFFLCWVRSSGFVSIEASSRPYSAVIRSWSIQQYALLSAMQFAFFIQR